ncbi:MAG: PAS domain S-box protein [Anaerolineaceae bacterium]|nr:PAS domain S-box protein [Anaerolineaceae bacterium]
MSQILILDNDSSDQQILSSMLIKNGYEVIGCEDFENTIADVLSFALSPDLILLAASSSHWDAYELCRQIKSQRGAGSIPVILIYPSKTDSFIEQGFEAGAVDYLVKPFIRQEVLARLQACIALNELDCGSFNTVKNSLSHQDVVEHQDVLEELIQKRTTELIEVNRTLGAQIAERQRVEQELQEQRSFLRLIIDTIPFYIFARDRQGVFTLVNEAVAGIYNTTVEKIVGQNYADFNPDGDQVERFRRQDLQILDNLHEIRVNEEHFTFNVVQKTRWLQIVKRPIIAPDGQANQVLAVMADITELKETELALRESEERFRLAFEGGPLGMFLVDKDLRLFKVNQSLCEMLGYDEQEITGDSVLDLSLPEDVEGDRQAIQELLDGQREEINTEKRYLSRQGEIIWANFTAKLIRNTDGAPLYVLGMVVDITPRKHTEEELQKHREHLEALVEQRTQELSIRNQELEMEILERKKAELAEREQRALAEALSDTAARLNSTLDLDHLLDLILANIEQVAPHDAAQVLLVEQDIVRVVRQKKYFEDEKAESALPTSFSLDEFHDLQEMVRSGNPYAAPNVINVSRHIMPMRMKWVHSYVGAPMKFGNKIIGFLCLFSSKPEFLGPKHGENLQAFANQASIAIRNAGLYEQQRELAALEERQRLAREMHDAVSQILFSACLKAETLSILWKRDPDRALQSLSDLYRLNRGALAEMRNLLVELRPQALISADLGDLIRQLADSVAGRTRIDTTVHVEGRNPLPAEVQIAFFRIAQEALNNIEKHACASQAQITLDNQGESVFLRIVDNGCGFDRDQLQSERLGMNIMLERAEAIHAKLNVKSQLGEGTLIEILWKNISPTEGGE